MVDNINYGKVSTLGKLKTKCKSFLYSILIHFYEFALSKTAYK